MYMYMSMHRKLPLERDWKMQNPAIHSIQQSCLALTIYVLPYQTLHDIFYRSKRNDSRSRISQAEYIRRCQIPCFYYKAKTTPHHRSEMTSPSAKSVIVWILYCIPILRTFQKSVGFAKSSSARIFCAMNDFVRRGTFRLLI
ncbi:hypothetical protein I7I48_04615 [Histoplasma ohiense]|nr:hypothetical protein I7I48_04615 [Histoplasma ohiense (nom. inval.)]